jgi:NTE family protein
MTVPSNPSSTPQDLALVLGGGGARAAYQAGVLRGLARNRPGLRFPIVTGVSAGAINATFLASFEGTTVEAADALTDLWSSLTVDNVFRASLWALAKNFFSWGCRLASCGLRVGPEPRALVDTEPLRRLLCSAVGDAGGGIPGLRRNIAAGTLRSLAVTTVDYGTGQSVVWMQGRDATAWRKPQRLGIVTEIGVEHVMASAALPIFFPAVQLARIRHLADLATESGEACELAYSWHGDGGIRLAPPFSPALKLGARRILAISTRYDRSQTEAGRPSVGRYPPPAQILGQLLNAIFLDLFDEDALRIRRLNTIASCPIPGVSSPDLHTVETLVLRPSADLGRLAAEFEPQLPRAFRFATRGLGTRDTESPDALSLIMFQSDYTRRLMDLGEADAEARCDEINAFLDQPPLEDPPPTKGAGYVSDPTG